MLRNSIPFVSLQITKLCNLDCEFCYRRTDFAEESIENLLVVVEKLALLHPQKIVFSGGEPLMVKGVERLLEKTKSMGIQTALQTNSILLNDKLDELADYIDWISLSLDGEDEESNDSMRGRGHFSKMMEVLPKIKKKNIKVKLGTVVTAKNYNKIIGIGEIIKDHVSVWKIYQYYNRKAGYANSKVTNTNYEISNEKYRELIRVIKEKYRDMRISEHSIEDFSKGSCLMVNADGNCFLTQGYEEINIGNVLTESGAILDNFYSLTVGNSIFENYQKTYK